jgi:hypothetical protein
MAHLLTKMLPIIMKLFLSEKLTDKIECFLEIGQILQAEEMVTQTLEKLRLTSKYSQV